VVSFRAHKKTDTGTAYIVDRSKVNAIFDSITLELSIMVYDNLSICVVNGNSLVIAIFGLVSICLGARLGPDGSQIPFRHGDAVFLVTGLEFWIY